MQLDEEAHRLRVLLANPPGVKAEPDQTAYYVKAGSRWPFSLHEKSRYCPYPFSLGYSSALLKRDIDAEVRVLDGVAEKMTFEDMLDFVQKMDPDMVLMEISAPTAKDDMHLLQVVKERAGATVAVSGALPTALPKETMAMAPWVDVCLIGEYELTTKDLVEHLSQGKALDDVSGLAYRRNDEVVINERRPLLKDLDYLPFPDREDLPATRYHDFCVHEPNVLMTTSRGCSFGCIFCVERWVTFNSPLYRARSAKSIVDEIDYCIKRFGAKQVYFDDQTFTLLKKHVLSVCDEIASRGLNMKWTCMGDAISVDYETLKAMAEAGCIGMKFGLESSSQEILQNIGKPLKLEKVKQVARWLDDLGMISHATYVFGLPGETRATVESTLDFALDLNTDSVQIAMATPFPGTPFYEWVRANNYLATNDWEMLDGAQHSVVSLPNLTSADIEELYHHACGEWSRKRAQKRLSTLLTHPGLAAKKMERIGLTVETLRIIRQALKGGV